MKEVKRKMTGFRKKENEKRNLKNSGQKQKEKMKLKKKKTKFCSSMSFLCLMTYIYLCMYDSTAIC
jgi:hypothetical protein